MHNAIRRRAEPTTATAPPRAEPMRPAPPPQTARLAPTHDVSRVPIAPVAQRKPAPGADAQAYRAPNRTGMPDQLKAGVEALSGMAMDDVRVHRNSGRPAALGALAYAQGRDIHLAPGHEKHLPHEAWHVVQQAQGRVTPTLQMTDGAPVNADAGLEREADSMGSMAASAGATFRGDELRTNGAQRTGPTLAAGRSPQVAVAQPKLDETITTEFSGRDHSANKIHEGVKKYNRKIKSKTISERINELSALEHQIYEWLDANKVKSLEDEDGSPGLKMKSLLTKLQREHQDLVKGAVNSWSADPPVANFDSLTPETQKQVRDLWRSLVKGSGNIRIKDEQIYKSTKDDGLRTRRHPEFRMQTLSNFARLLGTDFGRELVADVNAHTGSHRMVTIRPGFSVAKGDVPAEELLASSDEPEGTSLKKLDRKAWFGESKEDSEVWIKKQTQLDKFYPELDLSSIGDENTRLKTIHKLRKQPVAPKDKSKGFRIKTNGSLHYYSFGEGTASTITVPSDLRDGSRGPMSRSVDKDGNEIVVPVFISLGHELSHALHNLHGVASGDVEAQDLEPIAAPGINIGDYSGILEEAVTIRGAENTLRREHGLTERHSHHNAVSLRYKEIDEGPLAKASKDADKLPKSLRDPIAMQLKDIAELVGNKKPDDLKKAETMLVKMQEEIRKAQNSLSYFNFSWPSWLSWK